MNREQSGVCRNCAYGRWLKTGGGGEIILCRLSDSDARFPKYPRLPMLSCPGWSPPADVA